MFRTHPVNAHRGLYFGVVSLAACEIAAYLGVLAAPASARETAGLGVCQVVQWLSPTRVRARAEAQTAVRTVIDDDDTQQPVPLPQAAGAGASANPLDYGLCFCIDDISDYSWSSGALASAMLSFQAEGDFRLRWTSEAEVGGGCSNELWCGCSFVDPPGCGQDVSPSRGEALSEFEAPFQILAAARVRVRVNTSEEFGDFQLLNAGDVNQLNSGAADQTVILQPGTYRFLRLSGQATGADRCDCESSDGEGEDGSTSGSITVTLRDQGDLNCDTAVSISDIGPFVLALAQPSVYAQQFPACNRLNADMNCDGAVTVSDIARFVQLVAG